MTAQTLDFQISDELRGDIRGWRSRSLAAGTFGAPAVWQGFAVLASLCTLVVYWATRVSERRLPERYGSVLADYDLCGLDHGLDRIAFGERQALSRVPSDRRHDFLTPGQPDDDGRHDYAVLDADDYAVELVACA